MMLWLLKLLFHINMCFTAFFSRNSDLIWTRSLRWKNIENKLYRRDSIGRIIHFNQFSKRLPNNFFQYFEILLWNCNRCQKIHWVKVMTEKIYSFTVFFNFLAKVLVRAKKEKALLAMGHQNLQYRRPSLYASFLTAISCICNWEMTVFLELILKFTVILCLFICKFITFEPIFWVSISRI